MSILTASTVVNYRFGVDGDGKIDGADTPTYLLMGVPFCAKTSYCMVFLLCYLFKCLIIYLSPVPFENKNAKGKETDVGGKGMWNNLEEPLVH